MDYVPLGTTGVRISRIILGCGNFGGIGSAPAFFGQGENDDEDRPSSKHCGAAGEEERWSLLTSVATGFKRGRHGR